MEKKSNNSYIIFAAILVVIDQVSKLAIKGFDFFGISHQGLDYGQLIPVIGDLLQITYIENPGMAFGISFGWGKIFLSLFSIFASIVIFILLKRITDAHKGVKIGISLVLAGAFGNLIDRVFYGVIFGESPLFYGRVVDFVQVDIPDISILGTYYSHFPVFNVADSCVTVGVITLLIFNKYLPTTEELFKKSRKNQSKNETSDELSLKSDEF